MPVQAIDSTKLCNCLGAAVSLGSATPQIWNPVVDECGGCTLVSISGRFDDTTYYCSGTGTSSSSTTVIYASGSSNMVYMELGHSDTLNVTSLATAPKIPAPTSSGVIISDAIATLGASGASSTSVNFYITDGAGTTGAAIPLSIPAGVIKIQATNLIGETIPANGYIRNIVTLAGSGSADLNIGIYGVISS